MKIPIEWLKEYIDIKVKPQELAARLTISGTEIEGLSHKAFDRVVIGEIIDIKKHPRASELQIVNVDIGTKILEVVCGAKNIAVGQRVPVALPGAKLGVVEIQAKRIRGVMSQGMLCSEADLSISDDHTGIMILDSRAIPGANLVSALDIGGIVLEAELTPNRSDLFSILGVAREVKALFNKKLKEPRVDFRETTKKSSDVLRVEVDDFNLCPRYIARVVEVPKIEESPKWMQERLSACGVRPINAVVDITNYVMLEMGQPLHAFDAAKIEGEIVVRRAKNNERIQTLDGIDRNLSKENLVIADCRKPIALAGVMGSTNSEVDLLSKVIVLESAKFDKTSIRRTGNSLALRTEAVLRFEKEVPFDLPEIAIKRACHLLQNICGAKIYQGKIDIFKKKPQPKGIDLEINKVERYLGTKIPLPTILNILKLLGFDYKKVNKEVYSFLVPWWRVDISIWQDLIEEIARIYGYDKIPVTLPSGPLPHFDPHMEIKWLERIKNVLVELGFFEVYTYSFVGEELLKKAGLSPSNHIKINNPLSPDQEYLRTSLVPSLLEVVSKNIKNFDQFKIFETANVYFKKKNSFSEEKRIAGVIVGEGENIFYETKNIVKILLQGLGIFYSDNNIEISAIKKSLMPEKNIFNPERVVQLKINNEFIGLLGEAKREMLKSFDIKKPVGLFSLSLSKLVKYATSNRTYRPIPKFPPSRFDLAVVVEQDIPEIEVRKAIIESAGDLLYKIELFDIYKGKQLPPTKKSLAYHLTLQASDHTLNEEEINQIRTKTINALKKKLKAQIRTK